MLGKIPSDETLYSMCARAHARSANTSSKATSGHFLGHSFGAHWPDVFFGLSCLCGRSNGQLHCSLEELGQRTSLGAYLPLFTDQRRSELTQQLSGLGTRPRRRDGGPAWSSFLLRHELRMCPACRARQIRRLGFSYWRWRHQLPGVWVCHEHLIPLHFVPAGCGRRRQWLNPPSSPFAAPLELPGRLVVALAKVSECIAWMARSRRLHPSILSLMFRKRAREAGLCRCATRIRASELYDVIGCSAIGADAFGVPHYGNFSNPNWPHVALREGRRPHPLPWAVLLATCGGVTEMELTKDYYDALTTQPVPDMFRRRAERRIQNAPATLYKILSHPITVSQAARLANMHDAEVRGWLRRDRNLLAHRKTSLEKVKDGAAEMLLSNQSSQGIGVQSIPALVRWAVDYASRSGNSGLRRLADRTNDRQLRLDF
jgi:hypothetical protein